MSESKTVLVSGGAGYIGSALVSRLLSDTDLNVKVFDNLMYGGDSLFQFFNFEKFSFIKGDLRTFDLPKILNGVDFVVNLAALVGEPICKKYPKEAQEINFEANINLAKTCEKQGIDRYVMMSTCSNYGLRQNQEMLTESDELQPISLYSETKVNSDDLDRYLSILNEHSFDFDLKGYESNEANFFRYGGNYHDTIITNEQMKIFLDENQNLFNTLTNQYTKKLNYFKKS